MISRRTFLGFLSALVSSPLVARDMADFDFLPPELPELTDGPKVPFIEPLTSAEPILPPVGFLRYNSDTNEFEVVTNLGWETIHA